MLTRQAARLSASNEVWSIFRPLDGHTQYTITDAIPTAREAALPSFDHLVCSGNYRVWKVDLQRLRRNRSVEQFRNRRPPAGVITAESAEWTLLLGHSPK